MKKEKNKKIEEINTLRELSELLDKSPYCDRNEILKKMLQLASTKSEVDEVEERNDFILIDNLIPIKRVEIAITAEEIDDIFLKLLKTNESWALEKWMSLVKTVKEAKRINYVAIYYTSGLPIAQEITERCEAIFMEAVNTVTTIEELKEIAEDNYKTSGKAANKKWDRLSLKEVEVTTTDDELKIAKERSRVCSQAWNIASKRLKANEPVKPFPWL